MIFVAGGGGGGEVSVRSMVDLCDAGETGAFLGPPSDADGMISALMAADGVMMFSSTDVNILILVWRFAFFSFDLRLLEEEEEEGSADSIIIVLVGVTTNFERVLGEKRLMLLLILWEEGACCLGVQHEHEMVIDVNVVVVVVFSCLPRSVFVI